MSKTHTDHTDSATLIQALDALDSMPGAVALRERGYQLLCLNPDATVIDVGCGTGRVVAELADRGARAVGVDPDPAMLSAARSRFPGIDVRAADATDLPLADGEAHGYRADKVFHILPDPVAALTEARRVLAPGGRIVLIGQDWDTLVVDSTMADLTRRIITARADTIPHPRIARAYRNLLLDAGFGDVVCEVHTMILTDALTRLLLAKHAIAARDTGAITEAEAQQWIGEQDHRAATGRLMLAIPMFLAAGTR
ncbi:methyltransferase [Actinoplanes lobatus]|uniref:Methyltransferase n=1 Tax=Actinoplanes lobatus TaxID=113568 RepID=A0A7W7MK32_9ACTN|nr:methyltransferase domain-containing protein [Actinoplanes lobatus]MBB4752640.1 ubiquinone/menaquinone biosynthesis C-methylase UbiE [Actinoplanes lobatus]GGN93703.1 methyltransferase [Actinoplanes lobatus]GIE44694.1 methyltransferase [Actinoplanes lobatus]